MGSKNTTVIIDFVAELEKEALQRYMLHRVEKPFSDADQRKLDIDLQWRAAEEIKRLRGVIARHCTPSKAGISAADATIIKNAKRLTANDR
jgi:hypothetical protein